MIQQKQLKWYDILRKTDAEGSSEYHLGDLELITWDFQNEDGSILGWGGVEKEEIKELKEQFYKEFNEDLYKFYEYWPGAFRWTCCGVSGEGTIFGCDHHNQGCTCYFCEHQLPLSDEAKKSNIYNYGLKLNHLIK